jgi:hypothetical protein
MPFFLSLQLFEKRIGNLNNQMDSQNDNEKYSARGKKIVRSRKKNKKTLTRDARIEKFKKIQENFKDIKFKNPKVLKRKDKPRKVEEQLKEVIEIAEAHASVFKNTILKTFRHYEYFNKSISSSDFSFLDAFFYYYGIGEKSFLRKKKPWKNMYYDVLPKLFNDPKNKSNATKFTSCFNEVQLLVQSGKIVEKYKVIEGQLTTVKETWTQSDTEDESGEEDEAMDQGEEIQQPEPESFGNSAISVEIGNDVEKINPNELQLQNSSPTLHAYFDKNRVQLKNYLEALIDLRQFDVSESIILELLQVEYSSEIFSVMVGKIKKLSDKSSLSNIRLFINENKIHLLLLSEEKYDSLEDAIGTVLEKYGYEKCQQLSPKNMEMVVNCLEKEIIIYNSIDKEMDIHSPSNFESQFPTSIRTSSGVIFLPVG